MIGIQTFDSPSMTWQVTPSELVSYPTEEEVDGYVRDGVVEVLVSEDVDFEQTETMLDFLRFLRDATSHGLRVIWGGYGTLPCNAELLFHLYPPERGLRGCAPEIVERWREVYRFGKLYYRLGPDFLVVKDTRPFRGPLRIAIGEEVIRSVVEKAKLPVSLVSGELTEIESAALLHLAKYQLALHVNEMALFLPYRVKKWPIPYTGV